MNAMTKFVEKTRALTAALMLGVGVFAATLPAFAEVDIQKVESEKGITAWLVEDHTLPIVTVRFSFEGGSTQDPEGKEGLSALLSGLFDEGAGELDADAFQIALDEAGAEMRFGAGRDTTHGGMRMLVEKKDQALGLLRRAIVEPRFDAAPLERIRAQIIAGIVADARDPRTQARTKWREALYGDHPYARSDRGTEASLATINADDLRNYHRAVFARDTLKVAVVGAIDAETLKPRLDELFGELPQTSDLRQIQTIDPRLGQDVRVEFDLPQTSLQLAYPGVPRDAEDFFAAYIMNHILGGGTFSSWLFEEVRDRRGLAYSASSSLMTNKYASGLVIRTATRSDRAAEALGVIRDVVARMANEGPTEADLVAAKKYIIGSYALNNLDSSGAIASTLLSLQEQDLGIDYMRRREGLIEAVTVEDVKAAAHRLLSVEPSILVIGQPLEDGSGG